MLNNSFGLKKLGFGGARPTTSTSTRLASMIQDPSATNGLVNGGNWATGISAGLKGFLSGFGAMKDAQAQQAYNAMLQKQQEQAAAQEQANADREFNLKAITAGVDPAKLGEDGYVQQLQQQKLTQAQALQKMQWDREDTTASQQQQYKLAQIQEQHRLKMLEEAQKATLAAKGKQEDDAMQAQMTQAANTALDDLEQIAQENRLSGPIYSIGNLINGHTAKTREHQGRLQADIAALAPLIISVAKKSGASGINTIGEAMLYIGLPQNPTSEQLKGAIPRLRETLGLTKPQDIDLLWGD